MTREYAAWIVIVNRFTSNLYNFEEEQEPHYTYTGPGPDGASGAFPQEDEEKIQDRNPRHPATLPHDRIKPLRRPSRKGLSTTILTTKKSNLAA